jgi:hypothetical protein
MPCRSASFCIALLVLPAIMVAQGEEPPQSMMTDVPLFAAHDVVNLTIQAPLESIMKQRDQESDEMPGAVSVESSSGEQVTIPAEVRTRGKARLAKRICKFPPLRLNFPQDSVVGTLFEGQDKLKLVTHCQDDREEYEQYVLLEYLIYRTYQLFTDMSFRVRLARITYHNTEREDEPITRYGFLIEDEDMMAARTGWQYLQVPGIPPSVIDPDNVALLAVFQYFIGNTDFSPFMREPEKSECCHNTKPIGDAVGPVFSVPYDFDLAGLLDTRYANRLYRGNLEQLGLRSVRNRLYRGLCHFGDHVPPVLEQFNEKREAIYTLFREQEGLEPKVLEETVEYFDKFYETINDERKTRREIYDKCRPEG